MRLSKSSDIDLTLGEKLAQRAAQIRALGMEPTALIHLRKSVVERRRGSANPEQKKLIEADSEKRQLENCLRYCDQKAWAHEVYSDFAEGHHSGRSDQKRPAWKTLRAQVQRPEVIAVVVEILSRAYRNVRLMLNLLDNELTPRGIFLIVVMLPDVDFSTPAGRSVLISLANADELTSRMAGETMKSQITSYKENGRWWGMPPFGTEVDISEGRGYDYRLRRATTGIWWLGKVNASEFVEGVEDEPPCRGATWRGDFDACVTAWTYYVENDVGAPFIGDYLNNLGYRHRNAWRRNDPRVLFTQMTTRGILYSWRVFAGFVTRGPSRRHPTHVFKANFEPLADLDLLQRVGARIAARSSSNQNSRKPKHPPMLAKKVTRCADCGTRIYSRPANGGHDKNAYYYHYTVDCKGRHPKQYYRGDDVDAQILDDLEELFALPDAELLAIARRQVRHQKQQVKPTDKIRVKIEAMEREWRTLKLPESTIRELRATMERELLPPSANGTGSQEDMELLLPTAAPSPEDLVKKLKHVGNLIRRQRKAHPHKANQAIRALFQYILLREGEVVEYVPYAWCAGFFVKTGKVKVRGGST